MNLSTFLTRLNRIKRRRGGSGDLDLCLWDGSPMYACQYRHWVLVHYCFYLIEGEIIWRRNSGAMVGGMVWFNCLIDSNDGLTDDGLDQWEEKENGERGKSCNFEGEGGGEIQVKLTAIVSGVGGSGNPIGNAIINEIIVRSLVTLKWVAESSTLGLRKTVGSGSKLIDACGSSNPHSNMGDHELRGCEPGRPNSKQGIEKKHSKTPIVKENVQEWLNITSTSFSLADEVENMSDKAQQTKD
ncbi:uncharacterized protein LOC124886553 [Capsicum annuum]|uniref:uncharacterized protein LOC124886553 n=1 Tax=Capsicum annuum TaxID=4072 RepID=UPI001FB19EF3|nr:uncharacterized protein LOC124886553 [Capsicum annuum]